MAKKGKTARVEHNFNSSPRMSTSPYTEKESRYQTMNTPFMTSPNQHSPRNEEETENKIKEMLKDQDIQVVQPSS